jgi:predicted SAM-dependent methyltransferase
MTPIEQAYYLGVLDYLNGLYGNGGEAYSTAAQSLYQAIADYQSSLESSLSARRLLQDYLASSGINKLQLGAGSNSPEGWLSTDILPQSEGVVYLDATKPFPFDDDTFDYVHSEHLIEHISWHEGLFMLQECRRVLRPGGTVRVATPDLEVILGLYKRKRAALSERYVKWITDTSLDGINIYKASFVINNAFRNWGHQFLYDGELIELAMRQAGFTNIRRCPMGESDDENLRGIESHGRIADNEELVAFETMVFEGTCAA